MAKNNINYFEACEKYPDFPKFIILKMDMQRRGYVISDKAMQLIKHRGIYQLRERTLSREENGNYPISFSLRDGTSVITRPNRHSKEENSYKIDTIDEKFIVSYDGVRIDV